MRTSYYVIIAFVAIAVLIFVVSILRAGPENSKARMFVDSLFIFGALITGIGSITVAGFSKYTFKEWYGHSTKDLDKQVEIFLKYRRAQWRQGMLMLIFGIALICLFVAIGTFLRI
jgi:hypothetical protein